MAGRKKRKIVQRPVAAPVAVKEEPVVLEEEEQVDYELSSEPQHDQPQQAGADDLAEDGDPDGEDEEEDEEVEEDNDEEEENDGGDDDDDDDDGEEEEGEEEEGEEEEEEEEEEDIGKLLEPLSKDQLVALLRAAAAASPETLAEIRRAADKDPTHRKIFVHGLNWTTTAETLRGFFAQYGEIDECKIITDRITGKSKGYGFLLFRSRRSACRSLLEPQKFVDGRMTACQLASVGPTGLVPHHHQPPAPAPAPVVATAPQQYQQQKQTPFPGSYDVLARKIFVGNVHSEINGERLLEFFSRYGEIEEGPLGFDRVTRKPRGFALFIYRTVEGARKALEEPNKDFDGHHLYCQKATDSQKTKVAAAAAANVAPAAPTLGPTNVPASTGYNVPVGSTVGFTGLTDLGLGQGLLGSSLPFGQGFQVNPAALAMLAAAGQNPAAFGISPAVMASLNPALAAAMNVGGNPAVPPTSGPVQGYGMGNAGYPNVGYQGQQVQQGGGSYQGAPVGQGPPMRPPVGPMGGYGPH